MIGDSALPDGSLEQLRLTELECLAETGWHLFPCKQRDKTPLVKWGSQATSDLATLRNWWEQFPGCNWAVACGPDSGLWILDVDGPEGAATLDVLCREHRGEWLQTLCVLTCRGRHFYYRYSQQYPIKNSAGRMGPGLDVRGEGGYVLIPPSFHPSGHQYTWQKPPFPIVSAPSWLCEKAASSESVRPATTKAQVGILTEGHRNDGLIRLAGAMRRKGATQEQIQLGLIEANRRRCRPPLNDAEVFKIALSAARYEIGGPDPLEASWELIRENVFASRYEQLLALAANCNSLGLARQLHFHLSVLVRSSVVTSTTSRISVGGQ